MSSTYKAKDAMEPLAFAFLKGVTPKHHTCVLFDERIEDIDFNIKTDLIAMSVETFSALRSYEVARIFRSRGIPIIMGGMHPTFMPSEALLHADAIVVGDAEGVWRNLLEDFEKGQLKQIYQQSALPSLDDVPVDRSLFEGKKYSLIKPVQFSRGCRFRCDFCAIHAFWGNQIRYRKVADVIDEIKKLRSPFVFLVDDNLLGDPRRATEFLEAMIPLKKKWTAQISIDVVSNPIMLDLIKRSGCIALLIGFESLDPDNLKEMNKPQNIRFNKYEQSIAEIQAKGIMVLGTFVLGYSEDNHQSLERLFNFSIKNKLTLAQFNPLMPFPGTDIYKKLKEQDRLINDPWWLNPSYRFGDSMFRPQGFTAEELAQSVYNLRMRFNSIPSILKRFINRVHWKSFLHAFYFLSSNIVTRTELKKKYSAYLGGKH